MRAQAPSASIIACGPLPAPADSWRFSGYLVGVVVRRPAAEEQRQQIRDRGGCLARITLGSCSIVEGLAPTSSSRATAALSGAASR